MIARRRLLATAALGATGALIASGCQLVDSDDPDRSGSTGQSGEALGPGGADERPNPDLRMLGRLIAAEQELIDAYRVTIDAIPELPGWCEEQLRDHQQHLRALRDLAGHGPDAEPESTASPAPSVPDPPRSQKGALLALQKREQASADARDERLAAANGGQLARLIASIAASDALHQDRMAKEGT